MKTFLIILTFVLAFSGCSQKTAFSRFEMSQKQELGADSLQRSKLGFENKVNGIVSIVYLNMVFPEVYNDDEYFYINSYVKDKGFSSQFLLNNQEPTKIEKLTPFNKFTHLMHTKEKWSEYYLVVFPKQGDKLNFVLKNGPYSSNLLRFEKDE